MYTFFFIAQKFSKNILKNYCQPIVTLSLPYCYHIDCIYKTYCLAYTKHIAHHIQTLYKPYCPPHYNCSQTLNSQFSILPSIPSIPSILSTSSFSSPICPFTPSHSFSLPLTPFHSLSLLCTPLHSRALPFTPQ